jgi:hypothetical protein
VIDAPGCSHYRTHSADLQLHSLLFLIGAIVLLLLLLFLLLI